MADLVHGNTFSVDSKCTLAILYAKLLNQIIQLPNILVFYQSFLTASGVDLLAVVPLASTV